MYRVNFKILVFPVSRIYFLVAACLLLISCKKDWLEKRNNSSKDVPNDVADYQRLADRTPIFNQVAHTLLETSADNYYLTQASFNALNAVEQSAYIWAPDIFGGRSSRDWSESYAKVYYANVILEGLEKLSASSEQDDFKNVKGSALYFRSYAFFDLAQQYAKPYIAATANTDPGIILRTSSDYEAKFGRATVQQTYDRITADLLAAASLLPVSPVQFKTRPSKPAAYGLLARTYLSMRQYDKVLQYADSALKYHNTLIDFKTVQNTAFPFARMNAETIYFQSANATNTAVGSVGAAVHRIDTNLYRSYAANDLRKTLFFAPVGAPATTSDIRFKGNYTGSRDLFGGIATDELYLMRAEAYARLGNTSAAVTDLNTLLSNRYDNTFVPLTAASAPEALALVLEHRRKELVFRIGLRWMDLRRLNIEDYNITLTRNVNNKEYTLPPQDYMKYVLPIPVQEVQLNGIEQNPR